MTENNDDNKNNLFMFPGAPPPNIRKDVIGRMIEDIPFLIEYFAVQATLTRAKFDSLKKENFTDEQALELCKRLF
jgi:hypothetical protein